MEPLAVDPAEPVLEPAVPEPVVPVVDPLIPLPLIDEPELMERRPVTSTWWPTCFRNSASDKPPSRIVETEAIPEVLLPCAVFAFINTKLWPFVDSRPALEPEVVPAPATVPAEPDVVLPVEPAADPDVELPAAPVVAPPDAPVIPLPPASR